MKTAITMDDASDLDVSDIFDLRVAYEKHVGDQPRETKERQGYFHPSAVGMCERKNIYEYTRARVGEGHGVDSQEIFDLGHAIHDIVQTKIENMAPAGIKKYSFRSEVPYDPETDLLFNEFSIGGTTDGILEIEGDGWKQRGILEVKSINADGFKGLSAPKPNHVKQATLYAYRFNCPIIWIWYYSKNNSQRKVYTLKFDHELFAEIIGWYSKLHGHVKKGTLPERDESWYLCPRCEYKEICKPGVVAKSKHQNINKRKGWKK